MNLSNVVKKLIFYLYRLNHYYRNNVPVGPHKNQRNRSYFRVTYSHPFRAYSKHNFQQPIFLVDLSLPSCNHIFKS